MLYQLKITENVYFFTINSIFVNQFYKVKQMQLISQTLNSYYANNTNHEDPLLQDYYRLSLEPRH